MQPIIGMGWVSLSYKNNFLTTKTNNNEISIKSNPR